MRAGLGLVLTLAFAVSGCERGCLSRRVTDTATRTQGGELTATGTDCPSGLARCRDGNVEASLSAHVPASCVGEACVCPFQVVGRCARDCAAPGAVVAMPADLAREQMCRPAESASFASPPPAGASPACEAGFTCRGAIVGSCPSRAVATCTFGCAADELLDEAPSDEAAVSVLCRRAAARDP
jgi:hypothetical protein